MKHKYLLMDLDGTIIETKSGKDFPIDKDDWKFRKGVLSQIRRYMANRYSFRIITNQAGIDQGLVNQVDFANKLKEIKKGIALFLENNYESGREFKEEMEEIAYVADAYDHPGRKPNPYFIDQIKDIDKENSLYVGDATGLVRKIKGVPEIIQGILSLEDKGNPKPYIKSPKLRYEVEFKGKKATYFTIKTDFSDSDKQFAKNANIGYMDIDKFLISHEVGKPQAANGD